MSLSTTLLLSGSTLRLHELRREWREKLRINPDATVPISARQLGANYRPAEIIRAFAGLDRRICKGTYLIIRTFGRSGTGSGFLWPNCTGWRNNWMYQTGYDGLGTWNIASCWGFSGSGLGDKFSRYGWFPRNIS